MLMNFYFCFDAGLSQPGHELVMINTALANAVISMPLVINILVTWSCFLKDSSLLTIF